MLCLAPSAGNWPLPGLTDAPTLPLAIDFRGPEQLAMLHKDFTADPVHTAGLLRDRRASELWRVHADSGWPWIDIRFASGGRFIFCGFRIVPHWDASAMPREFLISILDQLKPTESSQ